MYDIKTEDVFEDFSMDKSIFDFSNYSAESKYYDYSKELVAGNLKMKQVMPLLENVLD